MNLVSKFNTLVLQLLRSRGFALAFGIIVGLPAFAVPTGVRKELPAAVQELLKYEQKFVNRTIDTEKIMELDNYQAKKYSPEKGQIFQVKSYWINDSEMTSFESKAEIAQLGFSLKRQVKGVNQTLLLVHPESERFYAGLTAQADTGPEFLATATASSRTLVAWQKSDPSNPFFAKLSLDKEIGGVVRTIPAGEVSRSIGIDKILFASKNTLPESFEYLPEVFGAIPKGFDRGGMILRTIPEKYQSGEAKLLPLFSIYTSPKLGERSPIELMIEKSGMPAEKFIHEKLIAPFAKLWVELAVDQGLAIEAHAQNVLMEVDSLNKPTGKFVFRDFGGFNVDLESRRARHLPEPDLLPIVVSEAKDYHLASHERALIDSLNVYFEGGFLFGLGEKMQELGQANLDYEGLTKILRDEIQSEIQRRGFRTGVGSDYSLLATATKFLQLRGPLRPMKCESVLRY